MAKVILNWQDLPTLIAKKYQAIDGLAVVHDNQLVFEDYAFNSQPEQRHQVASVTKSIISALIGIAIDKGYIADVNQKVLAFFPDYQVPANNRQIRNITLKHLLTMTASYSFKQGREPLDRLSRQKDWTSYLLNTLGQGAGTGNFQYSTGGVHLLSIILSQATGQSAREFANEHLFKPIGMTMIPDYPMAGYGYEDLFGKRVRGWVADPQGHSTGGWGLTLSTRDMARFGQLYLQQGQWQGKQIISAGWIKESTTNQGNDYGYLWWVRELGGQAAFAASGDGGNLICCFPEKQFVIAIASEFGKRQLNDPWSFLAKHIVSLF